MRIGKNYGGHRLRCMQNAIKTNDRNVTIVSTLFAYLDTRLFSQNVHLLFLEDNDGIGWRRN